MSRPKKRNTKTGHADPQHLNAHRLTRKAHVHELAEDYVETISSLIATTGEARAVDIARQFGVTHVTVVKAIARLQRDGLVTSKPYRSVFLTKAGQELADRCKSRHDLVVQFLLALGVPQETAIQDSEGIEHHVSPETLEAFRNFLKRTRRK